MGRNWGGHLMIGRKASTLALGILLAVAACGGSPGTASGSPTTGQNIGGSINLWAEWSSGEEQAFKASLVPFTTQTGVTVNYTSKGSTISTALGSAIQGGAPPDVALVPDPGTVQTLAKQGTIKDLTSIVGSLSANYGTAWNQLVTANGKLYGVWFKGSNKNTIWYNPAEFAAAGITTPPTTWDQGVRRRSVLALHRHRLAGRGLLAEHLPQDRRRDRLQLTGDPRHQVDRPDGDHGFHHLRAAGGAALKPSWRP